MARKDKGPGTFELLARLPHQISALVRAEYENAKQEIFSALKKISIGSIFLVLALFFLFWAIAGLGAAAIATLAIWLPVWASALIVAGLLLILTAVAILVGVLLLKRGNPVPEKTISRVSDDVIVASSIRYNASENLARERAMSEGNQK